MLNASEQEQRELEAAFAEEAEERFVRLAQALEVLASHPADEEALNLCFREVHSLKGAALVVGYEALGHVAHLMEDRMATARGGEQPLQPGEVVRLTAAADGLVGLMRHDADGSAIAAGLEGAAPPAPESPHPAAPTAVAEEQTLDTVRVATGRLDVLLDQSGELLVAGTRSRQRLADLRAQADLLGGADRERMLDLCRLATEDWARAEALAGQMEENIRKLRLLPLRSLFEALPRTVREATRQTNKAARLEIDGADVEVDKIVLERLKDPLTHLVRNAVDHGLEPPSERMLLGKPRDGCIRLSARLEGSLTVVEVSDDGHGLDRDLIAAKAVRQGLVDENAVTGWTDQQVFQLIFRPGFSTSETVSELSGRGVGMDVVARNVGSIEGSVEIDSRPNEGTTFRMLLPARLTTAAVLVLQAAGQRFALPLSAVDTLAAASAGATYQSPAGEVLLAGGELVPFVSLAEALGLAAGGRQADPGAGPLPVVILSAGGRRFGLAVDALHGQQDVVIKRFEPPLVRVTNFSASTILPDGRVSLILNAADLALATSAAAQPPAASPGASPKPARAARILVADDSLTARALQRNVLAAAGYQVDVAVDGLDAWGKLQREAFDLLITDVDMPNLTGFELTARLRADHRLGRLPVVIVTSMESDGDKRRGMEAGADAYIVKRAFDHRGLLETVRRLI